MQLAVEGKLGTQEPKDEPASKLRDRILAEKKRLIAAGKLGRDKEWPQNEDATPAFNLPASWIFSTLAEIGSINPRNDADDDQDSSFVPMKLINAELRQHHGHEVRKWAEIKKGFTHFAEGDVTLAKITPCFENRKSSVMRGLANGIGAGTTELHVVRPVLVDADYILIFLKSPLFVEAGIPEMTGTAGQKRIPTSYFASSPFPLPPLAEQRRIVAKVEELMGLCDALEAAQQEREAVRTRLRTSTLHQLAAPDSDSKSAAFAFQDFPRLTAEPEDIAQFRRSVLELAAVGKLTHQLKSDETAGKLVERMNKARKALAKPPKLSALPEKLPSELPSNWTWQPLCALLSEPSQNGYSQSADESSVGVPLLRISAGTSRVDGDVEETDFKRTTLDSATEAKFALQVGDLLAVRFNGNLHFTGKVTIYRGKLGMLQIFPDKLIRLRVWTEFVATEYVRLAMSAPVIRTAIESFCATSVGNMGISASDLVTVPIPLPPLAEQRRIVAKVDELMAVLDALEATLTAARTTSERLLAAVISKLHAA